MYRYARVGDVVSYNVFTVILAMLCTESILFLLFQESKSFGMNLFNGKIVPEQVFPFPEGKAKFTRL